MRWPSLLLLSLALTSCADPDTPPPTPVATATASASPSVTAAQSVATPPKPPPVPWIVRTLRSGDPKLAKWLDEAEELKLQILVTIVDRETNALTEHAFRVDEEYFYPASAIKLPLAVVSLQAMNQRLGFPVPRYTRIVRCRYDKSGCEPPREDEDRDRDPDENGKYKHDKIRVGEEIHKMPTYSDNDSYNRLWDIVGHREANEVAAALGLKSVRLHHRMNAPADRSVNTQRVTLLPPGKKAFVIGKRKSDFTLQPTPVAGLDIGKGYNAGKIIEEPMSFASKNFASLRDLQRILLSLVLPDHPSALPFDLSDEQRGILLKALTARLASKKHAAEHNPLSPGVTDVLPAKQLRYVGKSGRAYGFHLDNAYIEDKETQRSIFVAATVYTNPNGILNDDDYGYDDVSKPLLAAIGSTLTRALLLNESDQGKRQR